MTDFERIVVSAENGIGTITLSRPEKRNALDRQMVDELYDAVKSLAEDGSLHGILLRAEGPVFCAGADLAYMEQLAEFGIEGNLDDSRALARTMKALWDVPLPTIARVHGHAIAGGCGLATVCDIVIAARDAKFGYTEVGIGFVPAIVMTFMQRKSLSIRVRELLLTGRIVKADEAYERGLVTSVVDDVGQLDERIGEVVAALGKADSGALRLTKSMMTAIDGMSLEASLEYASTVNASSRMTDGWRKGIRSFLDR
jgi:methylglutaconyl-CoA hydratase